jgi:YggT family protein
MINALAFLLDTFSQLIVLLLLLRFWLPVFRASFQNPIAQGVLRFTSPMVVPVRRFLPAIGRLDTATVVVALLIQSLTTFLLIVLHNTSSGQSLAFINANFWLKLLWASFVQLAMLSILMFIVAIALRIILSLFGRYHGPITDLLNDITEPLLRPIRRIIPSLGVIDLSAYIGIVLLIALRMVLADFMPSL